MDFDQASSDDEGVPQVRVTFVTKLSEVRITEVPIAVPENLGRRGLSEVINHLLGRTGKTDDDDEDKVPIPFDVLVRGRFLRTSIATYMRRNAISGETVLELEYTPSLLEPVPDGNNTQPDWVSAIASGEGKSNKGGFWATACYDGCIRTYSSELQAVNSAQASQQPLTAIALTDDGRGSSWAVVGGKDRSLSLWAIDVPTQKGGEGRLQRLSNLVGHSNAIASVSAQGTEAVSGDWDGRVCLWDLETASTTVAVPAVGGKRRRAETTPAVADCDPLVSFKAHAGAVSGVALAGEGGLITGSWDRSVKIWDKERQDCTRTIASAKPVLCLDACENNAATLVATGHPDHRVRLWDTRAKAGETLTLAILPSVGCGLVYGVRWDSAQDVTTAPHHLATANSDGSMRLWDVRSPSAPLLTVPVNSGGPALCVAWQGSRVGVGGSDGAIKSFTTSTAVTRRVI